MERGSYPTPESIRPELAFVNIDAVENLRAQQQQQLHDAGAAAVASCTSINDAFANGARKVDEARAATASQFEAQNEQYLSRHLNREANPPVFDRLHRMLTTVSNHSMDDEKWYLGDKDAEGSYDPSTSGRYLVLSTLAEIGGTTGNPDANPLPSPEDVTAANEALTTARNHLAELSVKRRRMLRKGNKRAKALETDYDAAYAQYETARTTAGALQAQKWRHEGVEPTQVLTNVNHYVLDEHQAFTGAEAAYLSDDPSRMAKVSRFIVRHNLLYMGGNGAAGFGFGYGLGKVSKLAAYGLASIVGVAAVPAVLGLYGAVKTTKAVLQTSVGSRVDQVRSHDKRAAADYKHLQAATEGHDHHDNTYEQMLAATQKLLSERIDWRINRDVRNNRLRVVAATAISGAAAAGGMVAAEHFFGNAPNTSGGGLNSGGPGTPTDAGSSASHAPTGSYHGAPGADVNKGVSAYRGAPGADVNLGGGHGHVLTDQAHMTVTVGHGDGLTKQLHELAAQNGIKMNGAGDFRAYQAVRAAVGNHFFTNDGTYTMHDGNLGISRAAANVHFNQAAVNAFNDWLHHHASEYELVA